MKRIVNYMLALSGLFAMASCSDFTEIQPKGKNLLSTTKQLEMLLNYEYLNVEGTDMFMLCGDLITVLDNVPNMISNRIETRSAIMLMWDEANQDRMAELTARDVDYTNCYSIIGKISNPILSRVDVAEGDEATKQRLRCEALVLRAYYHWILVNKFAKAYNPETAAEDPGIPYMTEDMVVSDLAEKSTVQQVYDNILADLQQAIEIDALPITATNRMRMCKPCAYAAKALALQSMQRFDEAEAAARQALAFNDAVDNYNDMLIDYTGSVLGNTYKVIYRPLLSCKEDLFFTIRQEFFNAITPYAWNLFEEGHICRDKMTVDKMEFGYEFGLCEELMGLDYALTFDYNSYWNGTGMKTTHMYLVIAEAEIHKGNYKEAMAALDKVRVNRIDPAVYAPLEGAVTTEAEAIKHLKQTEHGENIYSVHGFINRKRWNQLDGYKETLTREIARQTFTLTPESSLWIFPFPSSVTSVNPNLTQNY